MILLNLTESSSPSRPTAFPSLSWTIDFSVIVGGGGVRVHAAAQVQDSCQIRAASLKEVSLNMQDCGRGGGVNEKKASGKNTVYWIPSQGQDKILVLRQSWLGRHIRGRPHKNLHKVSAGLPRGTKSNKLGGGWGGGGLVQARLEPENTFRTAGWGRWLRTQQMIQKADTQCLPFRAP